MNLQASLHERARSHDGTEFNYVNRTTHFR